jgi:microcystin-dependent protein
MSEAFVGEIRAFGFNFAPVGWAFCNGQLLSIAQNQVLFAILGTIYGGDGQSTFALPNLQGQVPMHWGTGPGGFNTTIGEAQGSSSVTLMTTQLPAHFHSVIAAQAGQGSMGEETGTPSATSTLGQSTGHNLAWITAPAAVNAPFSPKAISQNGGSLPHENMQPYLALNFCIALEGIFPSPN